jgi:hypothetical protein
MRVRYFTLQQYLHYTGSKKGWSVHQFTSKSARLGHLRSMTCAHGTALYNLYSRRVYGALDRDNLRNRRRLSSELIRTRLSDQDCHCTYAALVMIGARLRRGQ